MSLTIRLKYRRLMQRSRGENDEAGAVLVIFAIALAGMMGVAAMAIDLGNISQTKEHTETAVQDAVLSAVSDLSSLYAGCTGSCGSAPVQEAQAVTVAENYLIDNYGSLTAADFGATSCAGLLPTTIYFLPAPTSDCFGFFDPTDSTKDASNPTAMAVAIPTRFVNYTVGQAVGQTKQGVSSVAYALLQPAIGGGGFPFSYTSGGTSGLNCIKTGSGSSVSTCTGFATGSGSFGVINSPRYRVFPGNDPSGGTNPVITTDLVLGIDHGLNISGDPPAGSTLYCDQAVFSGSCPNFNGSNPSVYDWANQVMPQTGLTLNDPTHALFSVGVLTPDGSCTLEPLLYHPDGFSASNSCAADNPTSGPASPHLVSASDTFKSAYPLNGVQISAYLDANGQSLASACASDLPGGATGYSLASTDPVDAGGTGSGNVWYGTTYPTSYDTCLSSIMAPLAPDPAGTSSQAIFNSAIEKSPRFGQVPIVESASGSNPETIVGFTDVYLDVAFGKNKVGAITAWVFPQSMIDGSPGYATGGTDYSGGSFIPHLCSHGSTC